MIKEPGDMERRLAEEATNLELEKQSWKYKEATQGLDESGDPLEVFRQSEDRLSGQSLKDLEGNIPGDEDTERIIEKLPKHLKDQLFVPEGEIPDNAAFEDTLREFELGDEIGDLLDEDEPEWYKNYQAVANPEEEVKEKKHLSNSLGEFFLMEECSKFMAKTYLPEKFKQQRPMFLKLKDGSGIEMTDQRVLEHVQAFNDCKRNNKWHLYKKDEIDFMKRCAAWNHYYQRMLKKSKNRPTMDDGSPLSDEDIKDLALQYNQLRVKKPEEFAELKYEKHEWAKSNLQWIPGYYKDKKQWTAFVPGKTGKQIKLVTYSVPAKMSGEFYYVVDGEYKDEAKGFLTQFVNVRYPTEKNLHDARKEQQETAKEEKKVA